MKKFAIKSRRNDATKVQLIIMYLHIIINKKVWIFTFVFLTNMVMVHCDVRKLWEGRLINFGSLYILKSL